MERLELPHPIRRIYATLVLKAIEMYAKRIDEAIDEEAPEEPN